jgi:hypothetical protein
MERLEIYNKKYLKWNKDEHVKRTMPHVIELVSILEKYGIKFCLTDGGLENVIFSNDETILFNNRNL